LEHLEPPEDLALLDQQDRLVQQDRQGPLDQRDKLDP